MAATAALRAGPSVRQSPRRNAGGARCAHGPHHAAGPPAAPRLVVKICGVTRPEDALQAAQAGADFIGMVLWPGAKRSVSGTLVAEIAAAARQGGAEPVGVFVDDTPDRIAAACRAAGITHAQLHGDAARSSLPLLPASLRTFYVLHARPDGVIVTPAPTVDPPANALAGEQGWKKAVDWVSSGRRTVDFLVVDGLSGGSGLALPWGELRPPKGCSRKGWLLAGGLTPDNVASAVGAARPSGVDVSSGVADAGGLAKDHAKARVMLVMNHVMARDDGRRRLQVAAFVARARAAAAAVALPSS